LNKRERHHVGILPYPPLPLRHREKIEFFLFKLFPFFSQGTKKRHTKREVHPPIPSPYSRRETGKSPGKEYSRRRKEGGRKNRSLLPFLPASSHQKYRKGEGKKGEEGVGGTSSAPPFLGKGKRKWGGASRLPHYFQAERGGEDLGEKGEEEKEKEEHSGRISTTGCQGRKREKREERTPEGRGKEGKEEGVKHDFFELCEP